MSQPNLEQIHFLLIIIAIVLPPLGVFLVKQNSIRNKEFWVTLFLTICGHIPGTVFALYYMICIEFPKSRNGEGYHRLPEDEESQVGGASSGQPERHQSPTPKTPLNQNNVQTQAQESSSSHVDSGLPAYEEVVGTPQPTDSKANRDHKIQH